jgi:DNA ligase D-like protein (predicted polymerase)
MTIASTPLVDVDGRRLRLTNLDKVLYPETGTTKGDVIHYYATIAPALLPHLAERPVTHKRWPDGVGTADAPVESFFEKDLGNGVPDWVLRQTILHSGGEKRYTVVTDRATLVWLAQTAALELHVPQWRFDAERRPTRMVLDFDPGDGVGLRECGEVALWAKAILDDMGLATFPVTSGSKGISRLRAARRHSHLRPGLCRRTRARPRARGGSPSRGGLDNAQGPPRREGSSLSTGANQQPSADSTTTCSRKTRVLAWHGPSLPPPPPASLKCSLSDNQFHQ